VSKKKHLSLVKNQPSNKKRILWVSNSPWAGTGYGQQTAQSITRLKKDYEIAVASNYGLEAGTSSWNSSNGVVPIYPRGFDQWSNDVVPLHAKDWFDQNPSVDNLIITLFDAWVFKGVGWGEFKVASWVPVDHMPIPPEVANWSRLPFVTPIAMSKFGKNLYDNLGIKAQYVPHAIESVFQPIDEIKVDDEVLLGREFLQIPEDAFVVGMNAANKGVYPNRKAFGENLLAMSMFMQKHDDVFLYLHTHASRIMGGIDLPSLIKAVGIDSKRVVFIDQYMLRTGLSREVMALMYSSLDVLLATSYGEGFGVPTIEAQACGTRVIVSDFAASSELVGDGWKVDGQPLWDAPHKAWFNVPSVSGIVEALEASYQAPRERSVQAMEFAEQYRADRVYEEYWKPALQAIWEADFTPLSKLSNESAKTL
jgi:hypothetical protein